MTYRSAISRTSHRTQPRGEGFASAPFATSDLVLRFFRVSQLAPGRPWAPVQWSCMIFRNRWLPSAIPQEFCRNVRIARREVGKQGKFSCLPSTVLKDLEVALLRDPKLLYEPRRLAHMLASWRPEHGTVSDSRNALRISHASVEFVGRLP